MLFSFNLENIKYVKVSCKDSDGNMIELKAGLKDINHRNILLAARYENEISIPQKQTVAFNIVCLEGLYTTVTELLMVEYRDEYIYLTLALPKACNYHQNREYFRVSGKYPCDYIIEKDGDTKKFRTETLNISANGVTIYMPILEVSETGNKLRLNIYDYIINIDVDFVRSEKIDNGYSIAFHFREIKDCDRDIISKECLKQQIEAKRNSSL